MGMPVTRTYLKAHFERVAKDMGWNTKVWSRNADGVNVAAIDAVYLHHMPGMGWNLERIVTSGGGVTILNRAGRLSVREMCAFLDGVALARQLIAGS